MTIEQCQNFSEVLEYQAQTHPQCIFIDDVRSGRTYTFAEFDRLVTQTANFLLTLGVKPGDKITAVIENSPEYCFLYFASLRIGATFNPMPFTCHKEEVKKNVTYVEPRIVLVDARRAAEFEGDRYVTIPVDSNRSFEKSIANQPATLTRTVTLDPNAPACLYYSSGTTGQPKGVLFSHRNMIANISSICRGFHFSAEQEVHLVFLPLGHTASINYSFLPCMYIGGKMILAESFWQIRTQFWSLIEKHRVTYLEAVPTVLYAILNMHQNSGGCDVSSLRFVGCGSAPLQKSIQVEFEKRFGLKAANLYGLSETGPTHIDDPLVKGWTPGNLGTALDVNEVRIFDNEGRPLGPGQVGEIVVKGDNVFIGYFKNDQLYHSVVKNGYFHTGDLGYVDQAGRFHYVDRIKDLIIKGGSNIAPGEIDEVLIAHPSVKEAATIGIPDAMMGEDIKSFVVLKDGAQVSVSELMAHCRQSLSFLKVPKEIELVGEIPKTHSGKLLRKELRKQNEKAGV